MKSIKEIAILSKPKINFEQLPYVLNSTKVFVNLFEIKMKKQFTLYQYPYVVSPTIGSTDTLIRNKLFKYSNKKLRAIFGDCFISGDSFYSMKEIKDKISINCYFYSKEGRSEYTIEINNFITKRTINQNDIQKDPLSKQFIEMIIKDILQSNPNLNFYKDIFYMINHKRIIETKNISFSFYPGFKTSFVETDSGNYLNIILKNKIIRNETIYDYLNQYKYNNRDIQNKIKENLIGHSFKICYAKRNYKIDDILFDKTPKNTNINYEGETINLIKYYEKAHQLIIKDQNQPLILVKRVNSLGEPIILYFIPEFCVLSGFQNDETKDIFFMRELQKYTKLEPIDRVNKIKEILNLFSDIERGHSNRLSSKEKCELYGIEVRPYINLFNAYYMKEAILSDENDKIIHLRNRTFPVLKKKDMTNWVCFYGKNNYYDAENLYNNLNKASKAFRLKIAEPEWIEMENNSSAKDWIDICDDYFDKDKSEYDFAVFLLGNNDKIYRELKINSLCKNGYISQVIKVKSIKKKGVMSICSKILLQINSKLGGISYKLIQDKIINNLKIMAIGVNSSHIKGKGTGVGMVATINDNFSNFFNEETIIKEENNKEYIQYCVSTFISKAIEVYKKEKKEYPKSIIIYRQGVSLSQKEYLKGEISCIDYFCKTRNILYYYILVNTKTNFKFLEKYKDEFINPYSGLLVIDNVTNKDFFEFFIQPQEVTQGSATPTCFHVAYGNLYFPEFIPKFTYDLCHMYSNWQGTISIPNVIKAAGKLSKMVIKYTNSKFNENLEKGKAFF